MIIHSMGFHERMNGTMLRCSNTKKDTMVEQRNDSNLTHVYLQRLDIVLQSMLRAGIVWCVKEISNTSKGQKGVAVTVRMRHKLMFSNYHWTPPMTSPRPQWPSSLQWTIAIATPCCGTNQTTRLVSLWEDCRCCRHHHRG